jgi:alpha-tubulin suppressor-like RCC1 family protein
MQLKRFIFRLALSLCLVLLTTWQPPLVLAGIPMEVEHSVRQPEEGLRPATWRSTQSTAVESLDLTTVVAGLFHTCALTSGGGVKCWGANMYGQLGDGTTTNHSTPLDVAGLTSGVTAIAAGGWHTCALVSGGGVKCWGNNGYGQLGDGTRIARNTPVDVVNLAGVVTTLAVGGNHTCALVMGGGMKCWGDNWAGQLGNGAGGEGNWSTTAVDVFGLESGVTAITAGGSSTCAQVSGSGVKCWGNNGYGQLGDGTNSNRNTPTAVVGLSEVTALALAAGWEHTCALLSNGGMKCWGSNWYGQLGNGNGGIGYVSTIPVDIVGLESGVTAITAGDGHTCALVSGGAARCWGSNEFGQLGDGTTTYYTTPVGVAGLTSGVTAIAGGHDHTCARVSTHGLKCWGDNLYGQLGDGMLVQRTIPVNVTGLASGMRAIDAGGGHTCVLISSGGVQCWGSNGTDELGDGSEQNQNTPVDVVGLTSGVTAIALGKGHTCALVSSGGVKCWGENDLGQVGDGTMYTSRAFPSDVYGLSSGVTAIAASWDYTCALTSAGGVKCWGDNGNAQLGNGTIGTGTSSHIPVDVVGLASGVTAITASETHTCALLSGGGVKCWGDNWAGQLGNGTFGSWSLTPVDVAGLTSEVTAIATGDGHTCALTSSGGVKCWGSNWHGQLGNGTGGSFGDFSTTPVDVTGLTSGVTALAADWNRTCALLAGGAMKCWGDNTYGQLGDGTTVQRLTPVDVAGMASGVMSIAAGWNHTCALVSNGRSKCWGWDNYGQLGIGATFQHLTPVDVVESSLTINYPNGRPSSIFTVTGWNFPPDSQAILTVNGQVLTTTLAVNSTGSFIIFLNTIGTETGSYTVSVNVNPNVSTGFVLADDAPLRLREGGGLMFFMTALSNSVFLPLMRR